MTLAYSAPYNVLTYLLKMYKTAFCRRVNGDVLKVAHQKQKKSFRIFAVFDVWFKRTESGFETVLLTFHFEKQKRNIP